MDHDGRLVVRELTHLVACEKLLEQWVSREGLEALDGALVWDVWADGASVKTWREILRLGDREHGDLPVVLCKALYMLCSFGEAEASFEVGTLMM